MMMSDIYPLIDSYLCSASLDLSVAGVEGISQVSGNGNTVFEPGETWQFHPVVRNLACAEEALGVTGDVALSPASDGPVTLTNASVAFGDIPAAATTASQMPVIFELDAAAACGGSVVFDLENLNAANGGPFAGLAGILSVPVGEAVYTTLMYEDFSGGIPADWIVVHNGTATGPAATWTTDNPGGRNLPLTPPFAIVDSDEAGSGYTHDEEMITAPVDCTGFETVELRFNHDFNYYSGSGAEQGDVDVRSSATGGSWVNVANYSGGSASGAAVVDISDYAVGQTDVEIRFHYYDASFEWWWAVDDVAIHGGTLVCFGNELIFTDGFESGDEARWDRAED
jgi:hypothetical protein